MKATPSGPLLPLFAGALEYPENSEATARQSVYGADSRRIAATQRTLVPLSNGGFARIDAPDLPWLSRFTWRLHRTGYAVRTMRIDGRPFTVAMHREIARPLPGFEVDHANGLKLDNRRRNLRIVTRSLNNANSRPRGASGLKGVTKRRDPKLRSERWTAGITVGERTIHLGDYPSPLLAAAAYDRAALHHFGPHAAINGVDPETRARASRVLLTPAEIARMQENAA